MEFSVPEGSGIILNVGCGDKLVKGAINVDLPGGNWSGLRPDVECDIRTMEAFADDYADGIMAIHVVEHFQRWEIDDVLRQWLRVLKPGGELVIECPCLDKVLKLFEVPDISPMFTLMGLYGDPQHRDPAMMHKWCYSQRELTAKMVRLGFDGVKAERPQYHFPFRDMRVVATKPVEQRIVVSR